MSGLRWFSSKTWALEPAPSTHGPISKWSNKDMDPVPVDARTWSTLNYVAYWISDSTNVASWQMASSMLTVGLSWREALLAIAVGHIIISVVVALNGTIGARLHIAFPVLNRSSFGFWFSYFSVISRVILALFWFGVQTYTGSECVYQMLKALWPSIVNIPNHLSPSSGITTKGMMCYFISWLIQFPFMFVSPQKIRHLFTAKACIAPIAWLSIFIWAMVKVPPSISLEPKQMSLHGSAYSWAWLSAMNSALGTYASLAVKIPDFTRYAKTERVQFAQMAIIPTVFTFTGFVGIAVTSAGEVLYGETLWDPLRLIDKWDNRPAAFFAAFAFCLATLGTNISANSISAANDMTVLLPRYINIRRGQVICAIIGGWAVAPWEILATGERFLTFMSGYSIFLGPFAGIMATDYWIVHKCMVDVPAMYDPYGRYRYWKGVNWRAVVAILCSVPPSLPGLIQSIKPELSVGNIVHIFDIAWLYGFVVASTVFAILSIVWPAEETFVTKAVLGDEGSRPDSPDSKDSVEKAKEMIVV